MDFRWGEKRKAIYAQCFLGLYMGIQCTLGG